MNSRIFYILVICFFSFLGFTQKVKTKDVEILFEYTFESSPNFKYKLQFEKYSKIDSAIFSILLKDDKEVARNNLGLDYLYQIRDSESEWRITKKNQGGGIDEFNLLVFHEDNTEENSEGESSESDEENQIYILTGKSGDKLLKEQFFNAYYYFWFDYDNFTDSKLVDFIFPTDSNGLKDYVLVKEQYYYEKVSFDRSDSCVEKITFYNELSVKNLINPKYHFHYNYFISYNEFDISVTPTFCMYPSTNGKIKIGDTVQYINGVGNEFEVYDDNLGRNTTGEWVKVKTVNSKPVEGFLPLPSSQIPKYIGYENFAQTHNTLDENFELVNRNENDEDEGHVINPTFDYELISENQFLDYKKKFKTSVWEKSDNVTWTDTTFKIQDRIFSHDTTDYSYITYFSGYIPFLSLYLIDDVDGRNEISSFSLIDGETQQGVVLQSYTDIGLGKADLSIDKNVLSTYLYDYYENKSFISLFKVDRNEVSELHVADLFGMYIEGYEIIDLVWVDSKSFSLRLIKRDMYLNKLADNYLFVHLK